ncbi:MAG TPA: DsbA family protein [Oligoflexia bacterium]|nr:DsbA family protein [Oligoflexia bacterium]HMP47789.1 DsbA family protein [Oligoflexia bacterium]
MVQTVEIFYTFQCPYSYLAFDRLSQIENRFDVKVLWQPFSTRTGGKGFQSSPWPPDRTSYIKEDIVRLAAEMDIPISVPEEWPESEFDSDRSLRGALVAFDLNLGLEYNIKMFQRWWGEALDPNEQKFFIELCDDLDIDPNEFSGRLNSADTRERLKGIYKRARKLGIFDTPTILIGEERFTGMDRIPNVEARLKKLGLQK